MQCKFDITLSVYKLLPLSVIERNTLMLINILVICIPLPQTLNIVFHIFAPIFHRHFQNINPKENGGIEIIQSFQIMLEMHKLT